MKLDSDAASNLGVNQPAQKRRSREENEGSLAEASKTLAQ